MTDSTGKMAMQFGKPLRGESLQEQIDDAEIELGVYGEICSGGCLTIKLKLSIS